MITENKKNELIDRMHDAIVDNDNVCDTAKDCADVAISFTTEHCSKLNEIIGNAEAIYQEKCKAFEFEAMERRADIEDLEKENDNLMGALSKHEALIFSLEQQLEERNISIQAIEQHEKEIVVLKQTVKFNADVNIGLMKRNFELKQALKLICDSFPSNCLYDQMGEDFNKIAPLLSTLNK